MVEDLYQPQDDGSVLLSVHAHPGAGRTEVIGRHGHALKVKIAVPPQAGRANEAVAKLLADSFGLKPGQVSQMSGQKSRDKRFRLSDVGEIDEFDRLLGLLVEGGATPGGRRRGS
jgi:uncharacterized protein (TIGR00251 family)